MIEFLTTIATGLSILASLSLRPAKVDTCQFDYEITSRIETERFYLSVLFERDNNEYYKVQDYGFGVNFLHGQYYDNEAKGINTQELSITPTKDFGWVKMRGGIGRIWTGWKDPKNVAVLGAETNSSRFVYSTDLSTTHRLSISFYPQLALTEKFFLVPECKYEKIDEKTDWQFKVWGKFSL